MRTEWLAHAAVDAVSLGAKLTGCHGSWDGRKDDRSSCVPAVSSFLCYCLSCPFYLSVFFLISHSSHDMTVSGVNDGGSN